MDAETLEEAIEQYMFQPPFTAQHVEQALEALFEYGQSFSFLENVSKWNPDTSPCNVEVDGWPELTEYLETGTVRVPALGNLPITHVKTAGQFELSSGVQCVFKVGDQTFRKTGTYYSHDGTHWTGDLTQVVEREKTVKFWDAV
jgi:hypothetical protein